MIAQQLNIGKGAAGVIGRPLLQRLIGLTGQFLRVFCIYWPQRYGLVGS